jgi:lipopolysaccharide biosynthesis regulator YciM
MLENFSFQELKKQIESNKTTKLYTYVIGGILILVLGIFAYRQFIWKPNNEKSKDAFWVGLNYASKDSTDLAIDELKSVVKKYDGKIGGENAQFVLGRQYMAKGEFKKALEGLSGVDVNDTYVKAMALGLQGDCYSEMKDYKKAFDFRTENTFEVNSWDEFTAKIEEGGFLMAHWDGTSETEEKIKELTKATIRCIPMDSKAQTGVCVLTGKPSERRVIFARAY